MNRYFCMALMALMSFASVFVMTAQAQFPKEFKTVAEGRKLVVPAAKLMRVDEGVFEIEIGKTIDLTDRKMLLAVTYRGQNKKCCEIMVSGERVRWRSVGSRINLKDLRSTKKSLEDKDVCYLDVIDFALPKGAPGIATFRLNCI